MRNLLVEAWRAASASDRLQTFIEQLASGLGQHVPIARASLWRVDPRKGVLACLAETVSPGLAPVGAAVALSQTDVTRAQAWTSRGILATCHRDERPAAALAALVKPFGPARAHDLVIVPVPEAESGQPHVLIVELSKGARAGTPASPALLALGEPCAAAIAHHRRLEELGALRNAAEADRETLLRRLGREALSDEIIGANGGLKAVLDRVNVVARSDLPVLIFGETGAGKEVIARYLHERSPRKTHPFVRVNCGAIPPDLIDSELFGHERGAFTGAIAERRGWFEQADSGTLFLDEIGDLPLPAQVRLLRVLQDGTLQRVGGQHAIRVDVRIVAATHRDLPSLIERGEFREDLWYRLSSFPVFLPPLRERRGDIPQLADHFVRRAARRFGLHTAPLSEDHLALLGAYGWPGNVRELASVVDRAVIVGEGKELAFDIALGSPVRRVQVPGGGSAGTARIAPEEADTADALDDVVRRHVESVLRRTRGVIEGPHGAAAILRVNPHTLRARLRKLKVRWSDFRRPASP